MTIENKSITIDDLAQYYQRSQLIKPRLNRDLRWEFEHTKLFLEFTFKIRHILTPFLCTQTTHNNAAIYSVFDGNNRMNAIFSFMEKPLKYMESAKANLSRVLLLKPDGDKIYKIIENMNYSDIMNTTSLSSLCRKTTAFDAFGWFKQNDDREGLIETAYNEMHQEVSDTKFSNVKLTLTVFTGMTDDEIVDIFKNINTSGVELTPQDILKATSSLVSYRAEEIADFGKLVGHYRKFAEEQCEKELLIADSEYSVLSGFELLYGLQLWMHNEYPNIVDSPGKKGVKMDLIFKLHKLFCASIHDKNADELNAFIAKFQDSVKYLDGAYKKMFGLIANDRLGLTLNKQFTIHTLYFASGNDNAKDYLALLVYDSLCSFAKDKADKKQFDEYNPLTYHSGGNSILDLTTSIKESGTIDNIPGVEQIRQLMLYLLEKNNMPCGYDNKKRQQKPSKFEVLLLNMYFYKHVPPHVRDETMHLDHIIPVSTNGWSGEIDINRVGNKMMINSRVNIKKGCRALTDGFMKENKLTYYNYPSEEEYAKIVVDGVVSREEYDKFCERRENAYVDYVVSLTA